MRMLKEPAHSCSQTILALPETMRPQFCFQFWVRSFNSRLFCYPSSYSLFLVYIPFPFFAFALPSFGNIQIWIKLDAVSSLVIQQIFIIFPGYFKQRATRNQYKIKIDLTYICINKSIPMIKKYYLLNEFLRQYYFANMNISKTDY